MTDPREAIDDRAAPLKFVVTVGGTTETVEIRGAHGRYRLTLAGQVWDVDARRTPQGAYSLLIDGVSYVADVVDTGGARDVEVGGERHLVAVEEATRHRLRTRGSVALGGGTQTLAAPLPGKVTHVPVKPGDRVRPGDTLLVIEAMKMENEFKAATAGTVVEVRVAAGQAVNAGDVLIVVA